MIRARLAPVKEDQLAVLEQSNEVVRRVNHFTGRAVLPACRALLSDTPRLPGIDGRKASKSLVNAIPLGATPDAIRGLFHAMFTDPGHVRAADLGNVEGNVVFASLDAVDLKTQYERGGHGSRRTDSNGEGVARVPAALAKRADVTGVSGRMASETPLLPRSWITEPAFERHSALAAMPIHVD